MKIKIQRVNQYNLGPAMLIISCCGISLFFYITFPEIRRLIPNCYFYQHTGIPCPSCGATRSLDFFINRRFYTAFLMNPFFFGLYLYFFYFSLNSVCGLIFKKKFYIQIFSNIERFRIVLLVAFFLNWIYLIIK
ncbi:DUF2752 domain-containing protein [candidate division KSB1 bacterium]|nr:DUF2752 domain-containing protein [candidate division KSB1 bacterium]